MTMPGETHDACAAPLAILCTLGLRGLLRELAPSLAADGLAFDATYGPTNALRQKLADGAGADLAFMIDSSIDELIAAGTLAPGSRRIIARSGVAIAVKAGAAKPDISTPDAFKRALLSARSIAFTVTGASGIHFAEVIDRLGIADQIRRKAVIRDGVTGERAASGEVEIAVQQMSELFPVAGIDIVGPLPGDLQALTVFSASVFASSGRAREAEALIARLTTPEAERVIRAKGLEPASAFT
jgi:molybdate transport system substrate-binding protein